MQADCFLSSFPKGVAVTLPNRRADSLGPGRLWPLSLLFVTMYGHILRASTKHFLLPWRLSTSPFAQLPELPQPSPAGSREAVPSFPLSSYFVPLLAHLPPAGQNRPYRPPLRRPPAVLAATPGADVASPAEARTSPPGQPETRGEVYPFLPGSLGLQPAGGARGGRPRSPCSPAAPAASPCPQPRRPRSPAAGSAGSPPSRGGEGGGNEDAGGGAQAALLWALSCSSACWPLLSRKLSSWVVRVGLELSTYAYASREMLGRRGTGADESEK